MLIKLDEWLPYIHLFNSYGWFALILVLERLFPARPTPFLNKGWLFDVLYTYEPYVRAFAIGGAAAALVPYALKVPGAGILQGRSVWLNLAAVALASEATFYFLHRWIHSSPLLWEFHRVHHSSTTYYSLMTSRFHIVDMLIFNLPYVLIVAYLGVTPWALLGYAIFQGFMDRYGHSNVDGPRFHNLLGYAMSGPHFHAWHHSAGAADKNFSRDFTFMDHLFGTAYHPEGRLAHDFGDSAFPTNYFMGQLMPFYRIARLLHTRWLGRTPNAIDAEAPVQHGSGRS